MAYTTACTTVQDVMCSVHAQKRLFMSFWATSPFDLATLISYKMAIFPLSVDIFGWMFLCAIFMWPWHFDLDGIS